ncbi:MAG: hypothetical protein VKJ64_07860 [Leptolyngbyaceae bacterium]|nr:hypothetical protein [Leptolyngbyaceae bacterium]
MSRNQLEVRICGLQRSGNHAIIEWIINQHQGTRICFLNNVRHGNHNPFDTSEQILVHNFEEFPKGKMEEVTEALKTASKDLLIYSYEDDRRKIINNESFWNSVYSPEFEQERQSYLGDSAKFIDILIVRDPYNFFASRLKRIDGLTGVKDIGFIINSLKEIMREAIQIEADPNGTNLVIKYNQWFSDKQYRKSLSEQLGGKFDDSSLDQVSSVGGGSSFDGTRFNSKKKLKLQDLWHKREKLLRPETYQRLRDYWDRLFLNGARDMKVMERWKNIEDERMEKILTDPDIAELSKQLFGDLLKV